MKLTYVTHQQFLLELLKSSQIPGHLLDLAMQVKQEIQTAEIVQGLEAGGTDARS